MKDKRKVAVIVDDDESIRIMLDKMLSMLGYDTILFSSPAEIPCIKDPGKGHCIVADSPPDLIITDIQMPGMSGIELLVRLKKRGCQIKKVGLMTGYCNETLKTAADDFGCMAFSKPFSISEIKEWVNSLPANT